jgi:hypothetical protein
VIQWRPSADSTWRAKSADGYYVISTNYEAFHICALWARPESIGGASSLAAAQAICETHRASLPMPANN